MSRCLTETEQKRLFEAHLYSVANYWADLESHRDLKDRVLGTIFSLLVTLDGGSGGMVAWELVPKTPLHNDPEEARRIFVQKLIDIGVRAVESVEGEDSRAACSSVVTEFLQMMDGNVEGFPAFDLYPAPHPTDREFHIDEGVDYWPDLPERIGEIGIHRGYQLHDVFSGMAPL